MFGDFSELEGSTTSEELLNNEADMDEGFLIKLALKKDLLKASVIFCWEATVFELNFCDGPTCLLYEFKSGKELDLALLEVLNAGFGCDLLFAFSSLAEKDSNLAFGGSQKESFFPIIGEDAFLPWVT